MIELEDTGERMIPPELGEVSIVWSRHRFAYEQAASLCTDRTVLDVGCGTGYGSALLAEAACSVTAIDAHSNAILYATQRYARPNLNYVVRRAEDVEEQEAYDVIVSFQVIEHVEDPDEFICTLKRALKPGGVLLLTTPNLKRRPPASEVNPFHLSEMTHAEFEALLARHFSRYNVRGITTAQRGGWRSFVGRTPFYRWARRLKRGSTLKRIGVQMLGATHFVVIDRQVAAQATDLFSLAYVD